MTSNFENLLDQLETTCGHLPPIFIYTPDGDCEQVLIKRTNGDYYVMFNGKRDTITRLKSKNCRWSTSLFSNYEDCLQF